MLVHIAALLRGPVLHGTGEVLLLLCPRPRRNGQAGSREVNRRDRVWLVAGQPGGYAGTEVAAMRDEMVMSQPLSHQLMPESRDLTSGHPRGWGWCAERVAGQRRDDHRERVGRICAVPAWVRKERKDWQVLQE